MAGGQKGLSFIGEAGVAFALLGFISGCTARGWLDGQHDDPMSRHQHDCEQAWADSEAGKADEDDEVLLATPFCQQNNLAAVAEVQQEDQERVQEAAP